jgi:hypothetical protein
MSSTSPGTGWLAAVDNGNPPRVSIVCAHATYWAVAWAMRNVGASARTSMPASTSGEPHRYIKRDPTRGHARRPLSHRRECLAEHAGESRCVSQIGRLAPAWVATPCPPRLASASVTGDQGLRQASHPRSEGTHHP